MNPKTNETINELQYQIWGDLESWPNYVRNSNVTYDNKGQTMIIVLKTSYKDPQTLMESLAIEKS
ncbi:hypothetical protein BELL_0408g00020 [Botrytis elliptica]|uniref:Uncharacterized protein n=1 Tax=Botrytis elliptica TaxID=278938 RepID=A0A4Z1JH42_9HELO|nr:hypothetical protein BELL_0408g00020 [Botrytis elliptica]